MSVTGVEMSYGNYDLKPAPLITVGTEVFKQRDGSVIGGGYRVTLNGSLLPSLILGTGLTSVEQDKSEAPHALNANAVRIEGHQFDGTNNAMAVFRAKNDFLYAFNQDRQLFRTRFLGTGPLCSGYPIYGAPRVISVEFSSEDQWTHKLDYTVELFFNNSISTGTGAPGFPIKNPDGTDGPAVARGGGYGGGGSDSSYTGIIWSQSGAYDYIAGDLQSYSRDYSVEVLSKGAQIGSSGYLPTFFQVSVSTSVQVMDGTRPASANPAYDQFFGAPYSGVRPTLDTNAGIESFVRIPSDLPPIKLQGSGSLTEVMSGYLGATSVSGFSGIHTDSSYSYNRGEGSYNYNDTFVLYGTTGILAPTGFKLQQYPVMDTPTLDVEGSLENAIVTVTLQGELKGFAPYYGDSSGTIKGGLGPFKKVQMSEALANAQRYLDEAAYYGSSGGRHVTGTGLFYDRVSHAYSGLNFPAVQLLPLQPEPIAQSISYNTRESTIGYSFTYNNRPPTCFTGALHESITFSRGNPSDVHANLTILGRAKGPILQDIATVTASTTEINIEALIIPDSGTGVCTGMIFGAYRTAKTRDFYSGLLFDVESGISGEYGTYFVTSDNETYDPKTGRYSRAKAWIHSLC